MPRKNPLPEIDQAIARRLVELRMRTGLSRNQLADKVRWPRHLLARIELARIPLRYADGKTLLRALSPGSRIEPDLRPINPLWLIEGVEPQTVDWPLILPKSHHIGVPPSTTFLQVVHSHRELLARLVKDPTTAELPDSWLPSYFNHWDFLRIRAHVLREDAAIVEGLLKTSAERLASSAAARRTLEDYRAVLTEPIMIPRSWHTTKKTSNQVLTELALSGNIARVQDRMPIFMGRLRNATAVRGNKAALARFTNVSMSRISDWLAGRKEPSGENTLKLLHWVAQQEAKQQQSPGSATTPPGPKTQSGKSNEKKTKSGPQKG